MIFMQCTFTQTAKLNPSSYFVATPRSLMIMNNELFYVGQTSTNGKELRKTDSMLSETK
ncbi:MAG: hypothetical protein H7199_12185 [Burkholderiales bacterium]|nr:hypothetical protein [Flavobacterium sp.]